MEDIQVQIERNKISRALLHNLYFKASWFWIRIFEFKIRFKFKKKLNSKLINRSDAHTFLIHLYLNSSSNLKPIGNSNWTDFKTKFAIESQSYSGRISCMSSIVTNAPARPLKSRTEMRSIWRLRLRLRLRFRLRLDRTHVCNYSDAWHSRDASGIRALSEVSMWGSSCYTCKYCTWAPKVGDNCPTPNWDV